MVLQPIVKRLSMTLPLALVRTKKYYKKLFGKYLFITNTVSYVTLFGLGDALTQFLERQAQSNLGQKHDFRRTLSIVAFASFQGPVNHFWYLGLDKFIKDTIHRTVFKKLVADQLVFAPYACASFYLGLGLLEGQSVATTVTEVKAKFIPTYIADLSVWPAAQLLNFYVVPTHLRMMYINFVTLLWNTFMSYMKHKGKPDSILDRNCQGDNEEIKWKDETHGGTEKDNEWKCK